MRATRLVRRVVVTLLASFAVAVAAIVMCTGTSRDDGLLIADLGSMTIFEGRLNPDAVELAERWPDGVVFWLGESFNGLQLTQAHEQQNGFFLTYGNCRPNPRDREPSCLAPLLVVMSPRGVASSQGRIDPRLFRDIYRTKGGGPQGDPQQAAVLWLPDGSTVRVQVLNSVVGNIIDDVMLHLHTANHDAIGIPAIGPGESLLAIPRE